MPIAVFGPQSPISDSALRDQCVLANIPHIQATWQPPQPVIYSAPAETPSEEEQDVKKFQRITINFYPDSNEVSMAYAQVLKYYNWKSFAVLYEDDFGMLYC